MRFNIFDEIDREFEAKREHHKRIMMRKLVNQKIERERELGVAEVEVVKEEQPGNFVEAIRRMFEDHNREVAVTKRGHHISLPKMAAGRER